MNKRALINGLGLALGLALTSTAFAGPVTSKVKDFSFESLADIGDSVYGNTIVSEDFVLTNDCVAERYCFIGWGAGQDWSADRKGVTIFNNYGGTTSKFTRRDNKAFTFGSVDFADLYNIGERHTIDFTFTFADKKAVQITKTLDDKQGLETFAFNMQDVLSVSWFTNNWVQVDNVNLDAGSPGQDNKVPEPASLALVGLALGGAMLARRRHQKA